MTRPAPTPYRDNLLVRLLVPDQPSKLRLGLLAALLLLWIAVLVILYIAAVRPVRERRPTATQGVALSATANCAIC
jgi:hypothetical protein